jgi:hypothetical protein
VPRTVVGAFAPAVVVVALAGSLAVAAFAEAVHLVRHRLAGRGARLAVKVQSSSYERYPAVRYAGISSRRIPSREAGSLLCP